MTASKDRKTSKKKSATKVVVPPIHELTREDVSALMTRLEQSTLGDEDQALVKGAFHTLEKLTEALESKRITIQRLQRILFGATSEKTEKVLNREPGKGDESASGDSSEETGSKGDGQPDAAVAAPGEAATEEAPSAEGAQEKRKGHGRKGANEYRGAVKRKVPHSSLKHGDRCPECARGKVYLQDMPRVLIRIRGVAPLSAECIELARLRCNGCGEVYTAEAPEGVGEEKYDESAPAMIGLMKYGTGMPFERLERLQHNLGIPLPASTQWDLVNSAHPSLLPAHQELVRQAALGDVFYNDDTVMRILSMNATESLKTDKGEERTGVFTSGIVSEKDGRKIALFYTGRAHAGENLAKVLKERPADLAPPIQMSDALSRNTKLTGPTGTFKTLLASCCAHARRGFVDLVDQFPDECTMVLETFAQVYKFDDHARDEKLTPEARLAYHQEHSGPLMEALARWTVEQFEQQRVEPTSSCGKAIQYLKNHWEKLTLFLRVPGAPLDSNVVERALKKAILQRKNGLFFKTIHGARVGDTYMSLIYTTELQGENPFEYLMALLRHPDAVKQTPANWMPWTWRATQARIAAT